MFIICFVLCLALKLYVSVFFSKFQTWMMRIPLSLPLLVFQMCHSRQVLVLLVQLVRTIQYVLYKTETGIVYRK